jgi:HemY protein
VNFFRTLLWWLLLAAFGALAWDLLAPDLGEVLIRWQGFTVTTTVAFFLVAWGLLWFVGWMLWTLLRLPFTAWQRLAQTQSRKRLINGLVALHEGRHARAESLLDKAAEEPDAASVARVAAREAALRRGDSFAAAAQQTALARLDPLAAALSSADALLQQGQPRAALDQLQAGWERKALPPRGLRLRGEALVAVGRAVDAIALLALLKSEQSLSSEQLSALELDWQAAALRQSTHANDLHQRWSQLPARLREQPALLTAFAQRAGELGLESEAAASLAEAIGRQWDETLVREFARLPAAREDTRLAHAERWLGEHPGSAALSLCLGRLYRHAQSQARAEELLHRAIAQGAGADAWEELGQVYTSQNDAGRAQLCYANALRNLRGEPARALSGRSLREQIADEAVAEQRDEHGLPHLRF